MAPDTHQTTGGKSRSLRGQLPALTRKNVATAVGVAAAVVAGAVGVRAIRRRAAGGEVESIFHLRQDGERWLLELEGAETPKATFDTKQEGLAAARELAHKSIPCELIVYRTDGSVQDRHAYQG